MCGTHRRQGSVKAQSKKVRLQPGDAAIRQPFHGDRASKAAAKEETEETSEP